MIIKHSTPIRRKRSDDVHQKSHISRRLHRTPMDLHHTNQQKRILPCGESQKPITFNDHPPIMVSQQSIRHSSKDKIVTTQRFIAKPCERMMPKRDSKEIQEERETRGVKWEIGNCLFFFFFFFSVSADHINTFSGFGSFNSFFVQIKMITLSHLHLESNPRLRLMGFAREVKRKKEARLPEPKRCAAGPFLPCVCLISHLFFLASQSLSSLLTQLSRLSRG